MENTGVIIEQRDTDYIAGVNSPIAYAEINSNADWNPYITAKEIQGGTYFDTMACVSFSAIHCVEMILNQMIVNKSIGVAHMQFLQREGYLNADNKVDLSERFTAKMSGTKRNGNSCQNVWDSIRKDGVVPQADWTWNPAQREPVYVWEDFYAEIPQSVKEKGQRFLQFFSAMYEWVLMNNHSNAVFGSHLKQSPIQIISSAWPAPINGIYPNMGCGAGHATACIKQDANIIDLDHYEPTIKKLAPDYCITWALKGVVTMKGIKDYDFEIVNPGDYLELEQGQSGELLLILKNTGSQEWQPFKFNLGIPGDKPSRLYNAKWLDCPRPCTIQNEVLPGGSVMIAIPVTMPLNAQNGEKFRLDICPVIEGLKWLNEPDRGIYYIVTTK